MGWFIRRGLAGTGGIEAAVLRFRAGVEELDACLETVLPPAAAAQRSSRIATLMAQAVPVEIATRIANLPILAQATDIVQISERTRSSIAAASSVHFNIDIDFSLSELLTAAQGVPALDDYERMARDQAIERINDAHRGLAVEAIGAGSVENWISQRAEEIGQTKATLAAIIASGLSLPKLMVAAGMLADLSQARAADAA
jgi:glutamate dehydrogenase